jgi:hypothetical protein
MIQNARLTTAAPCPGLPDPEVETRGGITHPMNVSDLAAFGRSPRRWRFWRPGENERPWTWQDIVRGYALVPAAAHAQYTPRPRTYPALVNTCPVCGSVGTGEACRKCGQRRKLVAAERAWVGTAEYCRKWTDATLKTGAYVIAADDYDRALAAVRALSTDPAIGSLYSPARVWQGLAATWHDADTGLEIPLRAVAQIIPDEGSVLDMAIGGIHVTRDAAPGPWAAQIMRGQYHLKAALILDLVNAALGEARSRYLWCIVETEAPFLVARREPEPDLLQSGRNAYQQLLAAYARCVKNDQWPAFDVLTTNVIDAWSGVAKEVWMADLDSHSCSLFGVDAGLALPAV